MRINTQQHHVGDSAVLRRARPFSYCVYARMGTFWSGFIASLVTLDHYHFAQDAIVPHGTHVRISTRTLVATVSSHARIIYDSSWPGAKLRNRPTVQPTTVMKLLWDFAYMCQRQARIQVFGGVIGAPPPSPYGCLQFFLLVDLPRALQQFGSAPEIPVRNLPFWMYDPPPPPSESWIRAWKGSYRSELHLLFWLFMCKGPLHAEAAEHVLEWGGTGVRGHLTYKKNNYCPSGHSFLIHCRPSMCPSAGRALHTLGRNFCIAPLGTPSWYIVGLACTPVLVGHFILWGEIFLLPLWALLPDTL